MHLYYIMIKSSQKFWVVYVCYRFIPEQCESKLCYLLFAHLKLNCFLQLKVHDSVSPDQTNNDIKPLLQITHYNLRELYTRNHLE